MLAATQTHCLIKMNVASSILTRIIKYLTDISVHRQFTELLNAAIVDSNK